jgi:hypothetical protein
LFVCVFDSCFVFCFVLNFVFVSLFVSLHPIGTCLAVFLFSFFNLDF